VQLTFIPGGNVLNTMNKWHTKLPQAENKRIGSITSKPSNGSAIYYRASTERKQILVSLSLDGGSSEEAIKSKYW